MIVNPKSVKSHNISNVGLLEIRIVWFGDQMKSAFNSFIEKYFLCQFSICRPFVWFVHHQTIIRARNVLAFKVLHFICCLHISPLCLYEFTLKERTISWNGFDPLSPSHKATDCCVLYFHNQRKAFLFSFFFFSFRRHIFLSFHRKKKKKRYLL